MNTIHSIFANSIIEYVRTRAQLKTFSEIDSKSVKEDT